MSFEFTENVLLYLPEVSEGLTQFKESDTVTEDKLIVEIAAIHAGLTSNFNFYPAAELEKSLNTWVSPYPRPIIVNHDQLSDPLGRVMAAKMDKEKDGTPYSRLQVAVINPEAIERVKDQRFLTGSVGGKADHAKCSICNTDWIEFDGVGMPCKHQRGKVYNGKLAYLELSGLEFKEYSFVNVPADSKSGLRSIVIDSTGSGQDDNGEWVKAVNFFSFNMSDEKILSITESNGSDNILSGMKKKDAHYTYLNTKGTFLSVLAFDYKESEIEKSIFDETNTTISNESRQILVEGNINMTAKVETESTTEDILSIVEQVSADIASANVEQEDETTPATEEVAPEEEETVVDEAAEEVVADEPAADEDLIADAADEVIADSEVVADEEPAAEEELADQTDIDAADESLAGEQGKIEELETSIEALREENAKLRKTLHFMLAERVVDAKISVGLVESADRADVLAEHATRTGASLADALRDLEKYAKVAPRTVTTGTAPVMESKALATGATGNSVIVVEESETAPVKTESPARILENTLVEALMGRKKL